MKEAILRKRHRYLGVTLAIFIFIQSGTGLVITLGQIGASNTHDHGHNDAHKEGSASQESLRHGNEAAIRPNEIIMSLHHGGGLAGTVYRILLGIGILVQTVLGTLIFLRIRSRTRKST